MTIINIIIFIIVRVENCIARNCTVISESQLQYVAQCVNYVDSFEIHKARFLHEPQHISTIENLVTQFSFVVFSAEASFGFYPRPVLAFGYCHRLRLCVCGSVCVCVSLCANHLLVRAITQDPFKLGSTNLDQICKKNLD